LDKGKIKNKLRDYFKQCALGRKQLRTCVINAMNLGIAKDEAMSIIDEVANEMKQGEISFCAIVAVGEVVRYEETYRKAKSSTLKDNAREEIKNKLRDCFNKCSLARRQLTEFVVTAMDTGLTKEEILLITDDIVGGVGKDEVSLCGLVAVDQVLRYEESSRKEPIDIVKEREFERDSA